MRTSDLMLRGILLGACGLAMPLHADELKLSGGSSRLTGDVRSINGAGVVEFVSPLAKEPLILHVDKVGNLQLSSPGPEPDPPPALIELANGDILPSTLVSMDDRNLTVTSPEAGRLEIPRAALSSAQLGIRRNEIIYSGPKNIQEWSFGDSETKNWSFRNQALVARGAATAARKFDLPHQFILRFTLKWQTGRSPNFQVYFADPLLATGERSDRYYLQFGSAGLEIKREAAKGNKRYSTLVQLNRTPDQYPDSRMEVEIRVDRKSSLIELYINGELEDRKADPVSPAPDGSGIALKCSSSSTTDQEIRDIKVLEFDASRSRHHAEKRGNAGIDSLISRDDDRWGGRLIDIRATAEGTMYRFKSDFQDAPLEIPESEVSTVFFASGDTTKNAPDVKTPFVLHLRGNGSLKASSCVLTEDTVSAVHPLLGTLELRRAGVVSIERSADPKKPEPAPEP